MKEKLRFLFTLGAFLFVIIVVLSLFSIKKPKKAARYIPPKVFAGKIAIVLDDWGYSFNNMHIIEQIKSPLTIAVLPDLNYSRAIAENLHRKGFEIILHLPMEPKDKSAMEKNTIRISMNEGQIAGIIDKDLSSIPHVKGVSNHTGSMATSDTATMEAVFRVLKKRKLYFLDSYVTADSRCFKVASKYGLRFSKRDVFLDNKNDPKYIKKQLYILRDKARLKGYAIGIGHDRRNTLEVLRDVIPEFEKEGYKFVFLSEIVQ
ncbi:MAG: Divergent polysaccharide deacetylase [Candidatus Omnitrophica bacterium ADurb.Bin205]|nr:MAG: Divergent polysaccharide deacetylase [Candidatus Omnitrophica bacterium ADurb.Bin205]